MSLPYVIYKCAISADGYLDDGTHKRLILSNTADLQARNALRRKVDAVLLGGNTWRFDKPRLKDAKIKLILTRGSSGKKLNLKQFLLDAARNGVKSILLEGGGQVGSAFLQQDLVNELQVSVAPFFVGSPKATKFAQAGRYPFRPPRRMKLVRVKKVGDMAVITWRLSKTKSI
jgi:5-amino-6-(5-phosphoribosylamino)uracil reductase